MIARTPDPPYYAVIFTNQRSEADDGYVAMAERMVDLARQQPGYLGHESFRQPDGSGVTISYWISEEAIRNWKAVEEHRQAQEKGRKLWYRAFKTRVCRVERDYGFEEIV